MSKNAEVSSNSRDVLSVSETADYLGISESKVRQLIRRNAIPFLKLDGSYKFFLPALQDWLLSISISPVVESESADARSLANNIWYSTIGEKLK